jgi:methionine synthase II (cobalamin-independent)
MISGLFPRSNELIREIKKFELGKISIEKLKEKLESERTQFLELQKRLQLHIISEPHFNFHDLLRPFTVMVQNIESGTLTRYFETNTFYRKPTVTKKIKLLDLEPKISKEYNLPSPYYFKNNKIVLPSPNYFYSLSSFRSSYDPVDFFGDYLEILNAIIKEYDPSYIELVEYPFSAKQKEYEELLKNIKHREKVIVRKAQANLNPAGKIYNEKMPFYSYPFKRSYPVLQQIDTMNTKLEQFDKLSGIGVITGNENFDFLPHEIALKKLELMAKLEMRA